jgi:alcohol dehydrogenase
VLAAVMTSHHEIGLQDVPKPTLQAETEALIRTTATMICTSDVHQVAGYFPECSPFVVGHEFVGIVEEVGSAVRSFKPGDRVLAPPYVSCGNCEMCRNGISGLCPHGTVFGHGEIFGDLPGGLAEYVRVPLAESALSAIPDGVTDEEAVFVGDMLATGYFGVVNADVREGRTLAVFGAGPVGLCAVQLARLQRPSETILVGRRANRLEAGLTMGAGRVIDEAGQDPVAEIMKLTDGRGVDSVIDAVGTPESIHSACEVVAIGGTVSLIGFPEAGDIGFPLQSMMLKNPTIRMGVTDQRNMKLLLGLLAKGEVTVAPLMSHIMPLTDFDKAFAMFAEKQDNCMKVVLKP